MLIDVKLKSVPKSLTTGGLSVWGEINVRPLRLLISRAVSS
jgi:hypothetical protein